MSSTTRQLVIPLASSGPHLKMISFWGMIVLVFLLVAVLLVGRARTKKRRLQQVTDDRQQHAPTHGKER